MSNRAAIIRAENAGKPVVRRGRRFIEFDLGEGVTRHVTTIEPLHVRSSETEIDTAWIAGDAVYQWKIADADYIGEAKSAFNGAPLVRYTNRATSEWVSLQPRQLEFNNDRGDVQLVAAVQGVTAQVDDATLTWNGAFGAGIDYKWINHPLRLIKHLILNNVGVLPVPSTQITTGGNPVLRHQFQMAWSSNLEVWIGDVQWDESSEITTPGKIEFRLTTGEVVAYFAPASVWDAEDNAPTGVVQRVSKSGPNLLAEVRVPLDWLQSAAYPVTIDPTFSDQPDGTTGYDTRTREDNADGEGSTGQETSCGTIAGSRRFSLYKFDLSSIPGGAQVSSSVFSLWTKTASVVRDLDVNRIAAANSGWLETCTWNYADGAGASDRWAGDTGNDGGTDAGCSVSGTDWVATVMGSFAVTSQPADTEFQATLDVDEVEAMIANNYGMIVRLLTASINLFEWRSSDYVTASARPKLVIDYSTGLSASASDNITVSESASASVAELALSVAITPDTTMERGVAIYDV